MNAKASIFVTEEGIVTFCNDEHLANVDDSIVLILAKSDNSDKDWQSMNDCLPSDVIDSKSSTFCNFEQDENADGPIVVTVFGMVNSANSLHDEKAQKPIVTTPSGMTIFDSDMQPLKADSGMIVTPFGIVRIIFN